MIVTMLFAWLLAAQGASPATVQASPPPVVGPPPIVQTNVAPPPIISVSRPMPAFRSMEEIEPAMRRIDRLEVVVFLDRSPLWRGTLDVSGFTGASYSESRRGAVQTFACPTAGRNVHSGQQLNVSAYKQGGYAVEADQYRLSVSLERSSPSADCKATASKAIKLDDQATIPSGQIVELRGDGGLTVRVRRL